MKQCWPEIVSSFSSSKVGKNSIKCDLNIYSYTGIIMKIVGYYTHKQSNVQKFKVGKSLVQMFSIPGFSPSL